MTSRLSALALIGVLAAACAGSSEGKPSTLPTLVSPTATVAPTAVPIVVPADARAHTQFGAAAFVRLFFTELDKAYQAGRPFSLDGLAEPNCKTCRDFSNVAQEMSDAGQRFADPTYTDITSEAPPIENGRTEVQVSFLAPKRRQLDANGNVIKVSPDMGRLVIIVAVLEHSDGWRIRATQFQAQK